MRMIYVLPRTKCLIALHSHFRHRLLQQAHKMTKSKKKSKDKTKSSSKSKQQCKKSASSKTAIPRDESKVTPKASKTCGAPGNAGDMTQKVEVNRQALNQLIEMVEAVDPENIDPKSRTELKKVYDLVQSVQKRSVEMGGKKVDGPIGAGESAANMNQPSPNKEDNKDAPQCDAPPKSPSPPKEIAKEEAKEPAKEGSALPPNDAKSGDEPAKDGAKDGPVSTAK